VDRIVILKHSEIKWWTRSNDKISEVISLFASLQSNSVALEGSCQSMVYRSVVIYHFKYKKTPDSSKDAHPFS